MPTVAISAARTSARIWRQSGLAVPPPEARIWLGDGHAGVDHQVQPVPQPERHALQHGPGEVAPARGAIVSPTNAPRASGSGWGLRSPVR